VTHGFTTPDAAFFACKSTIGANHSAASGIPWLSGLLLAAGLRLHDRGALGFRAFPRGVMGYATRDGVNDSGVLQFAEFLKKTLAEAI